MSEGEIFCATLFCKSTQSKKKPFAGLDEKVIFHLNWPFARLDFFAMTYGWNFQLALQLGIKAKSREEKSIKGRQGVPKIGKLFSLNLAYIY